MHLEVAADQLLHRCPRVLEGQAARPPDRCHAVQRICTERAAPLQNLPASQAQQPTPQQLHQAGHRAGRIDASGAHAAPLVLGVGTPGC